MERPTPDELIDELRYAARRNLRDFDDDDLTGLPDLLEWEAADFIAAVSELLVIVAQLGGENGKLALALLAGDYPLTKDDGIRLQRFD